MDFEAAVEMCNLHLRTQKGFYEERRRGMRPIDLIVIHCSATRADVSYTEEDLERDHRLRGFHGCGYHFYVRRHGGIVTMRPLYRPGAHAQGYNAHSIGICYEGGLDEEGRPADTRTDEQKHSLRVLVRVLLMDHPGCRVVGHRDLSPDLNGDGVVDSSEWRKLCPCFDVQKERFWE